MKKKLSLEIVTPMKQELVTQASELVLPGLEGSFGVLPGHIPLVSALRPGMLKVRKDQIETIYAIGGGYAEISEDKVIVLADTAELADDIDIEAARREKKRALEQLKKGLKGSAIDAAEISLKKAMARLSVADTIHRRTTSKR